ncbi:DUF5694 domain-containing protein [Hymenobacter psychrophilus]|uniref:TraB family protein n=1 Tax=Hymenobacter psychrophilus TaxID=651662 RepID=A0A1H3B023_9BACT|nr:DUF5694 domain-containing protein [Hymenobacter psychrophilus]SDX35277.1 hypothetical protein SAMN04488069_101110 [Hymenobacter psychrophilus]
MRLLLHLSVLISLVGASLRPAHAQQPLEVVIMAASHYNGSPAATYQPIIKKLRAYQPDMVFGEYLTAADAQALPATNAYQAAHQRRLAYLRRRTLTTDPLTSRAATAAIRQLRRQPQLVRPRIDLARYYTFTNDRGNAEYQLYMLEEPLKKSLTASDQAYYTQAMGPVDSLRKARLVRPLTEYHKIIFPLLTELGQAQLYGMDCQRYDEPWGQAYYQAMSQDKALKAAFQLDSATAQADTYRRMAATRTAYFAYLNQTEDDVAVYRLLNSPAYEKIDGALNFFGGDALYDAPGFPTAAVQEMRRQWVLRNQGMCDNVVRQARQQGARRVLVAVGASHGQEMRTLLQKMPNVRVRTFNELP